MRSFIGNSQGGPDIYNQMGHQEDQMYSGKLSTEIVSKTIYNQIVFSNE